MTDTLFENARLIDPEAATDSIGSVLVRDGRIAAIGHKLDIQDLSGDLTRVDCKKQCLAPGLSLIHI